MGFHWHRTFCFSWQHLWNMPNHLKLVQKLIISCSPVWRSYSQMEEIHHKIDVQQRESIPLFFVPMLQPIDEQQELLDKYIHRRWTKRQVRHLVWSNHWPPNTFASNKLHFGRLNDRGLGRTNTVFVHTIVELQAIFRALTISPVSLYWMQELSRQWQLLRLTDLLSFNKIYYKSIELKTEILQI